VTGRHRPPLRLARLNEEDAIETLMKSSIHHFFPLYYDEAQTEASLLYVGVPDRDLIDDGTYYVAEDDGGLVACGGWSKRDKLYSGSNTAGDSRLLDPATEAAHIRAMFVRPDWGAPRARPTDHRGVGGRCEGRGFHQDVADGDAAG
jgi:hypothetical protein